EFAEGERRGEGAVGGDGVDGEADADGVVIDGVDGGGADEGFVDAFGGEVAGVGGDLAAADGVIVALGWGGGGGGGFGLALGVGAGDDESGAFMPDAEEFLAIVGEWVVSVGVVFGGEGADCGEADAPGAATEDAGGEGHGGAVIAIVGRWGGDGAFLPVEM